MGGVERTKGQGIGYEVKEGSGQMVQSLTDQCEDSGLYPQGSGRQWKVGHGGVTGSNLVF